METSPEHDLNQRIIELSKAVSTLFDTASSPSDIEALRNETLAAIFKESKTAREKLLHEDCE